MNVSCFPPVENVQPNISQINVFGNSGRFEMLSEIYYNSVGTSPLKEEEEGNIDNGAFFGLAIRHCFPKGCMSEEN